MIYKIGFLIGLLFCGSVHAQISVEKKGVVKNAVTNAPISNATIVCNSISLTLISDLNGNFKFILPDRGYDKYELLISCVGFKESRILLSSDTGFIIINLVPDEITLKEIVYSASRAPLDILKSPVSIEKLNAETIKNSPVFTFYDAISSLKGVYAVTSGLTYKQYNTRGFNNTGNQRFLQLIDGVDNQGPGLNFSAGNLFGASDLDVEYVELVPGAASALYGPIAFNGLLHIHTKDPFTHKGLSVLSKIGINNIDHNTKSGNLLHDYSIRYANQIKNRFAYKFTISYMEGKDWKAENYTDISPLTPISSRGPNNPGRDALNVYGDEVYRNIQGVGLVSRTGYKEKDLMDYNVYSLKLSGSVHYKFKNDIVAKYQFNYGLGTASYTGSSRYSLNNYGLTNHLFEIKGANFFWRAYATLENSGDTYNSRSLGQFLNRQWVQDFNGNVVPQSDADAMWFQRYEYAYKGLINGVDAGNHILARQFADQNRFMPGSKEYLNNKERITHLYGLEGSGVFTRCSLWHTEGQYDFSKLVKNKFELLTGGSIRMYKLNTNGSLFDDKNNNLNVIETGLFIQSSKELWSKKLRIVSSLRYDKNNNFRGNITPRFAMVYNPKGSHNFRASYQSGFRNPTIADLFLKLNVGPITILGGAPENSRGMNVYENSFTAASVASFLSTYSQLISQSGSTYSESLLSASEKLVKSKVAYIMPERLNSFEIGYRGYILNKLFLDVSTYYTKYSNFILNTVVQRPQQMILNADGKLNIAAAEDLLNGKSQLFQLYTNSESTVSALGYVIGLDWKGTKIKTGLNFAYNKVFKKSDPNLVVDFNTPTYSSNAYFGYDKLGKYGFRINWHWQDAFQWFGTFNGNRPGNIPAYQVFDLQISRRIISEKAILKMGGNNIFNHKFVQAFGSPTVGALYFISFGLDIL